MGMPMVEAAPQECQGLDFGKAVSRLPEKMEELFLAAGEQRLRELDEAMAAGNPCAVMDAAHSLASLTGLLPIDALGRYAREIYAAGERGELAAAAHAYRRFGAVMGWVLARLRERAPGETRP